MMFASDDDDNDDDDDDDDDNDYNNWFLYSAFLAWYIRPKTLYSV